MIVKDNFSSRGRIGSTRDDQKAHERRMCSVMQNPLPDHDVAGVPFVISAGVQTESQNAGQTQVPESPSSLLRLYTQFL
jgi:hypothetical protein